MEDGGLFAGHGAQREQAIACRHVDHAAYDCLTHRNRAAKVVVPEQVSAGRIESVMMPFLGACIRDLPRRQALSLANSDHGWGIRKGPLHNRQQPVRSPQSAAVATTSNACAEKPPSRPVALSFRNDGARRKPNRSNSSARGSRWPPPPPRCRTRGRLRPLSCSPARRRAIPH